MEVLESLKTVAAKLTRATTTINNEIAGLRGKIAAKAKELKDAQRALVPIEEARVRVAEVVATAGAGWLDRFGGSLLRLPCNEQMSRVRGLASPVSRGSVRLPDLAVEGEGMFGLICASEPKRAEAMLVSVLERLRESEKYVEGTASAERPQQLARLQAELDELGAAEEQLVDEAEAAGVTIAHRPEVVRRRQQAAERSKAAAEQRADMERRQAALDAQRSAARSEPRVGASDYIAAAQGGGRLQA